MNFLFKVFIIVIILHFKYMLVIIFIYLWYYYITYIEFHLNIHCHLPKVIFMDQIIIQILYFSGVIKYYNMFLFVFILKEVGIMNKIMIIIN